MSSHQDVGKQKLKVFATHRPVFPPPQDANLLRGNMQLHMSFYSYSSGKWLLLYSASLNGNAPAGASATVYKAQAERVKMG